MGRHGTIAGRKAAQDNKRAALFTKYTRAIIIAAKGGGNPDFNASLKNAIEKAKAINLPNDKIDRAIKKGTGELEGETYEEITFEGYGPGGVAIVVDVLTDNRNRATSNVKHSFDKNGGNMGVPGCVSYMFDRKGLILIENEDGDLDEDEVMETALDAGAEDFKAEDEIFEILTSPEDFHAVADALRAAGYTLAEADVEQVASIHSEPKNENDMRALTKLIDMLEGDDDVQKVYTNCSVPIGA